MVSYLWDNLRCIAFDMFGLRVRDCDDACCVSRKQLCNHRCIQRVLNGRTFDLSPNHERVQRSVKLGSVEARQHQNGCRIYPDVSGLSKLGCIGSRLEVISCSCVWCDSYIFQKCWNLLGYKCKWAVCLMTTWRFWAPSSVHYKRIRVLEHRCDGKLLG